MTATVTDFAPRPYDVDSMPIAGTWRRGRSGDVLVDTDPWNGATLLELSLADRTDVDAAMLAAQDAQRDWAATTPGVRAAVMRDAAAITMARKDEIVDWLIHEGGGTIAKSTLEWAAVVNGLFEASSMPHHVAGRIMPSDIVGKEGRVYRSPVGVVVVISPWNFPMYLSLRSVAPALAVGNAVVLKPASDTPVTGGLLLARIFEEAGLPPALLSVIVGSGREVGDALVAHPIPRFVSFTGSTDVGRAIPAKAGLKRLALELGGNGPMVVLGDADLDAAVDAAVFGSFFHQGQVCMIANRLIIEQTVHDEFVDRFVDRVGRLVVGDPSDPATAIGPIINPSQLALVTDKIERAIGAGAKQVLGGDPQGPTGLTLPPHILLGDNDVATAREEVFGPAITIIPAIDEADALRIANDTDFGLSSSVFTQDVERGVRFAQQLDVGMTHVNDSPLNEEPNTAFGGEKGSGIGRFGGEWAIEEFTTDHWISVQHERRSFPI